MPAPAVQERSLLIWSAFLAFCFAIICLSFGLWMDSLVIAFDGFYSLISMLLTLLSVFAAKFIAKPNDADFPFGRAFIEPLVIALKAMVIFVLCFYAFSSAVMSLLTGGREVNVSLAALIGLLNTLGCFVIWWVIKEKSKNLQSGLVDAESKQWFMDSVLSLAVTLGFALAILLGASPWAQYASYADPVMMLLVSFYFFKVPWLMFKEALRELLMMSPEDPLLNCTVREQISFINNRYQSGFALVGVSKVGRELMIRLELDMAKNPAGFALKDVDMAQQELEKSLSSLPYHSQLSLSLKTA